MCNCCNYDCRIALFTGILGSHFASLLHIWTMPSFGRDYTVYLMWGAHDRLGMSTRTYILYECVCHVYIKAVVQFIQSLYMGMMLIVDDFIN